MNPDFDRFQDALADWHRYVDDTRRKMEQIEDWYADSENFGEQDLKPKYSQRDMDYMAEMDACEADVRAAKAYDMELRRLGDEIDKLEDENRQLRDSCLIISSLKKQIESMKKLLDQYALYSEIEYDPLTYLLIGV